MSIASVQFASASASASVAFGSNNTAGNLLICITRGNLSSAPTVFSDTQGNSWFVAVSQISNAGFWSTVIGYAMNCKAGANTVSVTNSALEVCIAEYSGLALTSVLAQTNGAKFSSNTYGPVAVTTTFPNALLIGGVHNDSINGATDIPTGGFTDRVNGGGNVFLADKIVSTTGVYTYGGTLSGGAITDGAAALATFLAPTNPPAGGSGGWMQFGRDFVNKRGVRG